MKQINISRSQIIFLCMSIAVWSLRIIGLAPISFRRSIPRDDTSSDRLQPFGISNVGLAYNMLLLMPGTIHPLTRMYDSLGSNSDGPLIFGDLDKAMYTLRQSLAIVAVCTILIVWGWRQKKAAVILNLLFEVSSRLSGLKQQSTEKRGMVSLTMHLIINSFIWVSILVYEMDYTSLRDFVNSVTKFSTLAMRFWFILEYSMVVGCVKRKLRTVNQCLENYQELRYLSRPPVRNNRLAFANLITNCKEQQVSIRMLRSVRSMLVHICEESSDFFSVPVLFCVICSSMSLFHDLFATVYASNFERGWKEMHVPSIQWILLIILCSMYPVTSLARNVTQVKLEAELTGLIVSKLLVASRRSLAVQVELQEFSRELLHDDVDVFTAYGLFSLDSTLLPLILSCAVTYFLVLLQFQSPGCRPQPSLNCISSG